MVYAEYYDLSNVRNKCRDSVGRPTGRPRGQPLQVGRCSFSQSRKDRKDSAKVIILACPLRSLRLCEGIPLAFRPFLSPCIGHAVGHYSAPQWLLAAGHHLYIIMCMHESGMVLVPLSAGTIGGGIIAEPYSPYNSRRLFRQRKNRKSLSKFEHLLFPIIFLWLLQCRLPRTSCPIPDILICFAIMVELFYDCVIQCKDNSHSCRLCAITQRQHFMHCAATKQRWKRDLQHIFPVRTQTIHLWMVVNAVCVHNCYYSRFR